jgi:hypothetical protein
LEEGEGGRRSGKAHVVYPNCGHAERASTPLSICLSDPQGRDEAVVEGAQNSGKEGVHFWTHRSRVSVDASHEAPHPSLTLLARCECLRRHGVSELYRGMYQGTQTDSLSRWYTNSLIGGKGTQVGPQHPSPTSSSPFLGVAVALSTYRPTYLPVAPPVYLVVAVPTRMRVSHRRISHRRPSHRRVSHRRASHRGHPIGVSPIGVHLS